MDILKKLKRKLFKLNYRENDDISYEEARKFLKENNDAILIDVRSEQEYSEGHLQKAMNIPLYEIESKANNIIGNKDRIIILYCQSGIRSKKAVKMLKNMGYKNVYHIYGGLDDIK